MKILSIRQPWSWLIVHGLKDIENRDWSTSYRGSILIHAGKQFEEDAFGWIKDRFSPQDYARMPKREQDYSLGGIVGLVKLVDVHVAQMSDSLWFVGRYGFVLKDAQPLPFMPMRGQLGLFDAPADIVAQVRAECERMRGVA